MYNPFGFARHKDLPNLTPLFGNIGRDWNNPLPNDLYIKSVPKNVFRATNFIGNVGAGLDTLRTFVLPANTFRTFQSDQLRVKIGGGFGINDNNKRIEISFGGVILFNTGSLDVDNFGYFYELIIMPLSDTTFNWVLPYVWGQLVTDSGTPPPLITSVGFLAGARNGNITTLSGGTTFSGNDQTLLLQAESLASVDNDIINNIWIGDLVRF